MNNATQNTAWHGNLLTASLLATAIAATALCYSCAFLLGKHVEDSRLYAPIYLANDYSDKRLVHIMEYVQGSQEYNDVVFFGDSTCTHDIDTNLLERKTGLRAYNLGSKLYIGRQGIIVMLQEYLAHHPAPRLVVLHVGPHFFDDHHANKDQDAFLWAYDSTQRSARQTHENDMKYYAYLGSLYTEAVLCASIEKSIDRYLGITTPGRRRLDLIDSSRGSVLLDLPVFLDIRPSWPSGVSEDGKLESETIMRTCVHNGVPILILLAPTKSGYIREAPQAIERFLLESSDKHPGTVFSHSHWMPFDDHKWNDPLHLNREGTTRYAELVADEVLQVLRR